MEVETPRAHDILTLDAPEIITSLLNEMSAITDYRILRDSLPKRLAALLACRCVLLYQRVGETLQFAAASFDTMPGWSAALLSLAHVNPIALTSAELEAQAWRARHAITDLSASDASALVAVPLIYRQRAIGVMTLFRDNTRQAAIETTAGSPAISWSPNDLPALEAIAAIAALLLENARLLERDRVRIHELSLLNTIASQLNSAMYNRARIQHIVIQRTREITGADLCEFLSPANMPASSSWVTPMLYEKLAELFQQRSERQSAPLVIERSGDDFPEELMACLPPQVKTFFAQPLLISETMLGEEIGKPDRLPREVIIRQPIGASDLLHGAYLQPSTMKLHGIIVGAYHRAWKLRREEAFLLQILASQASATLENIHLMSEVIEARNEARKLLRQVLDDQRLKELILESVPGGLIACDLNGRITTFNRAASVILGYHAREALGQPLQRILRLPEPLETLLPRDDQTVTLTVRQLADRDHMLAASQSTAPHEQDEQQVILDIYAVPLLDDQRRRVGALATFTDVTAMHRLEEEKRRLDRLATLGEMAASVAHEVRNPLASIKTSLQMLQTDLASDAPDIVEARESIAIAQHEVERLDAIVHELLVFARPRQLHRVPYDLAALSDLVLRMIQPQCLERGVSVHRVYHATPPAAIDVAQMEQVLLNLYTNALQAMPGGGILTVACQVVREGTTGLESEENAPGADATQGWIELLVSDTGSGIAPDHLEHIFQPFFTTKAHGIGLGLPITRRLVEDHGGYLRVSSQLGYGSTFTIRLPLVTTEAEQMIRPPGED